MQAVWGKELSAVLSNYEPLNSVNDQNNEKWPWCVSDTAIIKVVNSILIGFKKETNVWYCKSSQEPMIWKLTGSRSELTTVILDFVTNLSLYSHIDTHRLVQLSYIIREISLCRR